MRVSIWSDIRCPFCYIGKRKFEAALANFAYKDKIAIEWKSFELDPNMVTEPIRNYTEHFMERKGVDKERALDMFDSVTGIANEVGLNFNFENTIPANSLKAHRLLHLAKELDKVNKAKEALLSAYLEQGKNIDDIDFLLGLAENVGLDVDRVKVMYESDDYTYEVRQDEMEARNLGINGVPFFVLDNKYGISGAQPVEVFAEAIETAWQKHSKELTIMSPEKGNSCDIDGNCD